LLLNFFIDKAIRDCHAGSLFELLYPKY